MSKILHATKIVESNPEASSKELIEKFIGEVGMTKVMARTYLYNIRKKTREEANKARVRGGRRPQVKAEAPQPLAKKSVAPVKRAPRAKKAAAK